MTTQIIRTVEELEALDPYDVIAYKSPEGYDLVCTAYEATIGDADYTLPVAPVCSHSTAMSALRALNEEHPMTNIDRTARQELKEEL